MTPRQEEEIGKLIDYLELRFRQASSAKEREKARRRLDAIVALKVERDALMEDVRYIESHFLTELPDDEEEEK